MSSIENLRQNMVKTGQELGNDTKGVVSTVKGNVGDAASSVKGELGQLSTRAQGISRKAIDNLKKVGKNVTTQFNNLSSGIGDKTRKLRAKIGVGGIKRRRKSTKRRMRKRRTYKRKNLKGGTNATPEQAEGIMENMALLNSFDKNGVLEGMGNINKALGGALNSLKNNLGSLNTAINKESMKGGKRRRKGKKSKKVKKRRSRRSRRTYGGNTPNEEEDYNEEESEPEPELETESEPPVEVKTNSKIGYRIATEDKPCGFFESLTGSCKSQQQHYFAEEKKQQQGCIKDCKKSKTEGGRRRRRKRGTKKKRKHR
jgi:hypothetical protein